MVGYVYFPIRMGKYCLCIYSYIFTCFPTAQQQMVVMLEKELEQFLSHAFISYLWQLSSYWKKTHPTEFLGYWKCSVAAETTRNEFSSLTGLEIGRNKLITYLSDNNNSNCCQSTVLVLPDPGITLSQAQHRVSSQQHFHCWGYSFSYSAANFRTTFCAQACLTLVSFLYSAFLSLVPSHD